MDIKPIDTKTNFGIYKYSKTTPYGKFTHGEYRGYNIDIYDAKKDNAKLYYISNNVMRWVKSKLVYLMDGVKRTTRSTNNGM